MTAQERMLEALRTEVLTGALQPGERVVQELIAEQYGVSRVPVREALQTLTSEGLITHLPHRGYFVTELSVPDLLEVYRQSLAAGGVELSADALWAQYRANAGAGLHMTVVASMLVGRHDRGDAMFCAMAERHTAHMDDLETLTIISG